jgi:hypothetical protein
MFGRVASHACHASRPRVHMTWVCHCNAPAAAAAAATAAAAQSLHIYRRLIIGGGGGSQRARTPVSTPASCPAALRSEAAWRS